jgi:hypothetical protein
MATKNALAPSELTNTFLASARFAPNPFETPVSDEVPSDAPEGSYTYAIVQSAPAMTAEECEAQAAAIEIMIRWGANVLKVDHLTPPRSYYVGEVDRKGAPCDFVVPADKLGAERMPLVLAEGGDVRLVLPAQATGTLTLAGGEKTTVAAALAKGLCRPCASLDGASELPLTAGCRAEIEIGGLVFQVGAVQAGKKVAGGARLDADALPYQGLSFLLHAGVLAATALFMPPLAMADEEGVTHEQRYMIQTALQASALRDVAKSEEKTTDAGKNDGPEGGTGARAMHEEGKMGSATSKNTNGRYAIQGEKNNPDVMIPRWQALKDAETFGMIGILSSAMGTANVPTAAWGAELASGNDPQNKMGNMWGATLDDAAGSGGLGLTGVGEGGGSRYQGIGMGPLGTIGHGAGLGDGQNFGNFGRSKGFLASAHKTASPVLRGSTPTVSGRIPPEVIQRIVRQNFGRFRLCYENGLRTSPSLQGRVSIRFVIGRDGSVQSAANGGSDLPDASVASCVARAFYGLSFPQPDGGIVTVTYPIMFSPGGA